MEQRCPGCGYLIHDAQFHMDHRLCRYDGNAPWQAEPFSSEQIDARKKELHTMLAKEVRDAADIVKFRALAREAASDPEPMPADSRCPIDLISEWSAWMNRAIERARRIAALHKESASSLAPQTPPRPS